MKKNDFLLLGLTALYSFLFYKEFLGLNLALFTLLLVIVFGIIRSENLKNRNWQMLALGTCFSAFLVGWYGNAFAIITTYISILLLTGISLHRRTSIFFAFLHGIFSFISSFYYFVFDYYKRRKEAPSSSSKWQGKWMLIIIPILIFCLFFILYRASNPLFDLYASKINLDWISIPWFIFTLIGMAIIYGTLNGHSILFLAKIDHVENLQLVSKSSNLFTFFGKPIALEDEYFSGKLVFILLNILIASVNFLDLNFVLLGHELPDGLTYADMIHQGVGMLVFSILLSIGLVLFYFRGEINFLENNSTLKYLAYLWIVQNLCMLLTVCFKNQLYIDQYGLTYKRIGIYIYVSLTFIGLITTFFKIYKVKINLYLLHVNGWVFYTMLLSTACVNWDAYIVEHHHKSGREMDVDYLLSFSYMSIPKLIDIENQKSKMKDIHEFHLKLDNKITNFYKGHYARNWKSWNFQDQQIDSYIRNHYYKITIK